MVEIRNDLSKEHPEIARARKVFEDVHQRFIGGVGEVTSKDVYRAVIELNTARLNYDENLQKSERESEREILSGEVERYTPLVKGEGTVEKF